jgi:two-component system, cell cycle response regulator CpdR
MAHILLADDDKATRDLVKRALESEGHSVEVTQDGTEALEKLKAGPTVADVLVSDVHMPGIDGIVLAGQASAARPKLRILLMSGFPEELERAKSVKAARLDVLTKPFTLEQVRAAVRALLA